MRFKDKVVIVTGAASGIGREIALSFAREQANVVIADIALDQAEKVAQEVEAAGGKGLAVKTDVSNGEEVKSLVRKALETFGKIDILVNNAAWWPVKYFMQQSEEEWDKQIKIIYYGTLYCTRAVLEHMIERKSGVIINIISDAGRIGEPTLSVYSGAKAAVNMFSKALAKEMGRYRIRINCVAPSLVETPGAQSFIEKIGKDRLIRAYPLGRLGLPKDVARAVLFLASDEAEFITGQTLSVNGGYLTVA
jgi:NAD(P)-dependent dehydrogenase (short-subunit alcohol dehydrogenase family)